MKAGRTLKKPSILPFAIIAFVLIGLWASSNALDIKCDPEKVYVYSYEQSSSVFGGTYLHIKGTLELYCKERVFSKKLGTHLSVTSLHLRDAVSYVKPPKCTSKDTKSKYEKEDKCETGSAEISKPKPYKGLERSFGFVQTSNGKIVKMFTHKGETVLVRDLKKAIVSQFQTKLRGNSRVCEDNTGVHRTHYRQQKNPDGSVSIKAEHSGKDAADKETKKNSKGTEQSTESEIKLTRSGAIKDVETDSSFEMDLSGDTDSVPYAASSAEEKKKEEESGKQVAGYMSVSGHLELHLRGTRKPHGQVKDLHQVLKVTQHILEGDHAKQKNDLKDDHDFELQRLDVLEEEILQERQLRQHGTAVDHSEYTVADDIKKKVEENHGGFPKLLNKLLKDASKLALVIQYVEYFPEKSLPLVLQTFKQNSNDFDIQSEMMGLMAESQTIQGFRMIKSIIQKKPLNHKLIEAGLFYMTSIEQPTVEIAEFVKGYISFMDDSINETIQDSIRTNAFLYLANIAAKMKTAEGKKFTDFIIQKIKEARESEDSDSASDDETKALAIHNLGYKGNKVAADLVQDVVDSDLVADDFKVKVMQALQSHVNDDDGEHEDLFHADALIHHVAASPEYSDEVRVAAIRTQTLREKTNKNSVSVPVLMKVLYDPSTSEDVVHAVLDYLKVANKDAVSQEIELLDTEAQQIDEENGLDAEDQQIYDTDDVENDMSDVGTLEAKPLIFRKIGRAISSAAKKVVNVVTTAAKKAADLLNVKKHAENVRNAVKNILLGRDTRDFSRRCFRTTRSGNDICANDPHLKNLLGSVSGALSTNMVNSKHYIWEKKAGNDAANAYISFMSLSASKVPGCRAVGEKDTMLWAIMASFNSEIKLLMFQFTVFRIDFRFNRLTNSGNIDDSVAVKFGLVALRTKVIPRATLVFNGADFNLNDLLNCEPQHLDFEGALQREKKIFEKEKIVMAGFVPLKLSASAAVVTGVGVTLDVCMSKYRVMAGPSPYIKLSTELSGGLTLLIVDGMLAFSPETSIRVPILMGLDRCTFGVEVSTEFIPFSFSIDLVVKAKVFSWSVKWNLYSWSMRPLKALLFKWPTPGSSIPDSEQPTPLINNLISKAAQKVTQKVVSTVRSLPQPQNNNNNNIIRCGDKVRLQGVHASRFLTATQTGCPFHSHANQGCANFTPLHAASTWTVTCTDAQNRAKTIVSRNMRIGLRSIYGRWLAAESTGCPGHGGRQGCLNANRPFYQGWEQFTVQTTGSATQVISGAQIGLRSFHGLFVVQESNHVANANRPWFQSSEHLRITKVNPAPPPPPPQPQNNIIRCGDRVRLQGVHASRFLTATQTGCPFHSHANQGCANFTPLNAASAWTITCTDAQNRAKTIVSRNMRIGLRSIYGRWLAAESSGCPGHGGRQGCLNANRPFYQGWEQFTVQTTGSATQVISGAQIGLRSFHGLFVVQESNHVANANRPWFQSSEHLRITKI